jgi:NADH-quinone oxidoreductase subunit J
MLPRRAFRREISATATVPNFIMLGLPVSSAFGAKPVCWLAQSSAASASTSAPSAYIPPALLFVLALVAAIGVILLLPGRMEPPLRKIGAVVLWAAGLIFAALLAKAAGGMGAYFWIFSAIAVVGAIRVITHPKPVYSALYFILVVMASAGLFVMMWAEFMAAALILIYAGAILITYVFVIMLAAEAQPEAEGRPMYAQLAEHDAISREPIAASAVGFALLGILLFVIFDHSTPLAKASRDGASGGAAVLAVASAAPGAPVPADAATTQPAKKFIPVGHTQRLGAFLFERQLVNLELAGLILTVAMVGAIVIARKRVVTAEAMRGAPGETVIGPATPVDDNPHSIPVYGTENPRQKEYPET